MLRILFHILSFTILLLGVASAAVCFTRDEVVERDALRCGVSTGIPGFSNVDGKGNWSGIDVDICRAVAAAVLGDAAKVTYTPLLPGERVTALLAGDIDLLSRNYAWNYTRDSALPLNFAAVVFYDLQGFLVSREISVESILELKDFTVCYQDDTSYGERLGEYLQESELQYKSVVSDTPDQIIKDFEAGRCEVITGGRGQLQGLRSKMSEPAATAFLPEVIANVPLGPAVRHGDDVWLDIVKWSVFAMIYGEELGLTSDNIDDMATGPNQAIQRFVGTVGTGGKGFGLKDDWAYQIIKQVGSYGEVFERNLGESSPLKLKRGLNNLWNEGGILFAPPLR
jgi:general L-amino acid transport system substrate-binding protein